MPPSGIMAPWAPLEDVEPPYRVGNLDGQERAVYGNVQHIKCMGLRLCSSDPLDQSPRMVPPGYRYIGGSMIGMMRTLNRSSRNALKDGKLLDAMIALAKRLPTLADRPLGPMRFHSGRAMFLRSPEN
ncbi:hypothetical protein AC579_7780 [Pseudocercospora musae]|uniref:Uncharacterized protein n=1 Tax=Pseudocercospora musae TaxID=113226 RepID=A0A139IJT2_9PEZI|nr:hypothetical protein AC579_7780 [Pseudocercospora musae]